MIQGGHLGLLFGGDIRCICGWRAWREVSDTPWIYTSHEHDEDGDDNEIFLLSAINSDLSRLC